jgi:WD40 repeat protein/serine/threonine protein kinase
MKPTDIPPGSRRRELFLKALEKTDLGERRAFLDAVCGHDRILRDSVNELLAHHREDGFMEESPAGSAFALDDSAIPADLSDDEAIGDRIGRYKLLQKVGEGGCGVVYMAEQEEPVRRRVALKVIKLGMDTKSVIARFEAERQALAMMDHPNIAKVFDAGATGSGSPYFVMELVRGVRITDYCDQHHLATRDRLELFIKVCQAIQHAHQKGIIHRDIKPSNILVTLHDGVPVPKVIDFGIAKATTDQRLTDKTLFTALEQFVGTPAYMSPEQAEMSGLDIDTRSDIYSLGVLLYELLTGKTPFDARELLSLGLDAMRRTIREQEPARPSTRLSTMPEAELTTTAKNRQSEAVNLIHLFRGDVDWIVMKCLEKDRARRYETVGGLASDILRQINNETVLARPPSAGYRFQKLVRRNKLVFSAASVVLVTLIVALSFSTWALLRERKAHSGEVEQRKLADMQLALQAWEEGDLQRANDLMEASRPASGRSPSFEWRYLKQLCQDESIETFRNPTHPYRSAQFFGRDLLLNDEKTLTIHSLSQEKDQLLLEDQDGIQNAVFCFGDTNLLATVTEDRRIKVWNLSGKRVEVEFEGHPHPSAANNASLLAFSADGKRLVSAIWDSSLMQWDVEARNPKPVRTVHRYGILSHGGVFSLDGKHLFSVGSESVIRIWNVVNGAEEAVPLEGHTSWIYAVAISADGTRLASAGADSTVLVWDVTSRKLLHTCLGHIAMVIGLAFSPDGQILASAGWDHTIRLWDVKNGQQRSLLRGHGAEAGLLSFSPDGQLLVSQSRDGLVKLWKPAAHQSNILATGRSSLEVVLSPDRRRLVTVGSSRVSDFSVRLVDLSTGTHSLLNGHTNAVMSAAFSPDGRMLATGSHDQTVRLWGVDDRRAIATLTNGFPVGSLAFTPDGRTLIVGGSKHHFLVGGRGGLQFWDVASQRAAGTIARDASNIVQVALSADGSLLATGHKDGAVCLWNSATRQQLHRFVGQPGAAVLSLAFSPVEPLLAASGFGGNIALYNTSSMEMVPPLLKAHTGRVTSIAFSPDGRTLASAGEGGGLKLWNVAMHQVALALKGHVGVVKGVTFSRDSTLMVSCGLDGTVRLWSAGPE